MVHITRRIGQGREFAHQSFDFRALHFEAGRAVRSPDSEQDFELGILLERVRANGFVEARVFSVDRFQDGDGWLLAVGGWRLAAGGTEPR